MGLFKKIKNKKEQPSNISLKNENIQDEKFVDTLSKKILTNLRIIESMLYSMEYKLATFNSLTSKEVESFYDNTHKIKQNVNTYKDFAIKHNLTNCISKANTVLERIENIIYIFNEKLTGIIY